jgi:hypothetical protein
MSKKKRRNVLFVTRGVATGSETIHISFTKEAAAALIPDDTLFIRKAAATLENIHTCFEKEVAATTLKKINTFSENSELLGASTKILDHGGANLDGSKLLLMAVGIIKTQFLYFISKY